MIIGVIGSEGVVGKAITLGFQKLGHKILRHDTRLKDSVLTNVYPSDICYICVPTPSQDNGECDTSIVEAVVKDLVYKKYNGVIAIKSTVSPGTTEKLMQKYKYEGICFVPEFLRERFSYSDFIDNHDICAVGTYSDSVFDKVVESHGTLPKHFFKLTPTEAELLKYYNNVYHATLITLSNSFYELCKFFGNANYFNIKDALTHRNHIVDLYLDCNEDLRGFGGMCLPKDIKALAAICKNEKLNIDFFEDILKENAKYKMTCYEGMRTG